MYPAFAELPLTGRYVDNMAASKATMEELKQLVRDAEIVFKKVKISGPPLKKFKEENYPLGWQASLGSQS